MNSERHGAPEGPESTDDLLDRIAEQADADEMARILAMDDAALDAELAAGGLDPKAVRAKGRALGEAGMRRWKRARWLQRAKIGGAAAGVAIALAAGYVLLHRPKPEPLPIGPDPSTSPLPSPSPAPPPPPPPEHVRSRADDLVAQASDACDAKRWQRCLELLEAATELQPALDSSPKVKDLRRRAVLALDREVGDKPK